jgi:hypothetical protein
MRNFIDIIEGANAPRQAQEIYASMSMLARYRLHELLPYTADKAAREAAAIDYIAAHLDEYTKPPVEDTRDIADGGIHRLY